MRFFNPEIIFFGPVGGNTEYRLSARNRTASGCGQRNIRGEFYIFTSMARIVSIAILSNSIARLLAAAACSNAAG